jgi:hypothetical protein
MGGRVAETAWKEMGESTIPVFPPVWVAEIHRKPSPAPGVTVVVPDVEPGLIVIAPEKDNPVPTGVMTRGVARSVPLTKVAERVVAWPTATWAWMDNV